MNIIIITGASSGIGREFARQMDGHFDRTDEFWLVARNRPRLEELAGTMRHRTRIFAMDITGEESLEALEEAAFRHNAVVRMLINCAGYGIMGSFCEQDCGLETGMIRLNCEALTELTHRLIPYMRWGSRIIQLSSSAAFLPQPGFAVYAATKAYVLALSKALHDELRPRGIKVLAVCPGPMNTDFWTVANVPEGKSRLIDKLPRVDPKEVAEGSLRAAKRGKLVYTSGFFYKVYRLLAKLLPHGFLMEFTEI